MAKLMVLLLAGCGAAEAVQVPADLDGQTVDTAAVMRDLTTTPDLTQAARYDLSRPPPDLTAPPPPPDLACLPLDSACSSSGQCCGLYVSCRIPATGGITLQCCGTYGHSCTGLGDCCSSYSCQPNGTAHVCL